MGYAGRAGRARAAAGCDKEATFGWGHARLGLFECLEVGLRVEVKLRWIGARVGIVVAMVGVTEDGSDGLGVFDHGDQAHGPVAPGADERVVEGPA